MYESSEIPSSQSDHGTAQKCRLEMPPPPAPPPSWLSHIPALTPDQFPRSPVPFLYDSPARNSPGAPLSSSPTYNLYLLNSHPAYAPPPTFGSVQQVRAGSVARSNQSALRSDSPTSTSITTRGPPVSSYPRLPSISPGPQLDTFSATTQNAPDGAIFPRNRAQMLFHLTPSTSITSPTASSIFQPPLNGDRRSIPPDLIDPALYNTDQFRADPIQAVGRYPAALNRDDTLGTLPFDSSEDDSVDDDETDIEDVPGLTWPGRGGKRAADDAASQEKRRGRAPKRQKAQEERKRGRPKGEIRGPRTTLDPGPIWMKVYNEAVDALNEDNDLNKAQLLVLQAINDNPEIFAGHKLLADVHFARGEHDKGFDALMVGLHAHINEVDLWRQTADTILHYPAGNYQKKIERAMYCYGAIVRKDPKDLDARFQRAECARLKGSYNRAFKDMKTLLDDDPHNSAVLAQFTKLCLDINDIQMAVAAYDEHFDYYKTTGLSDEDHFTWQDIGVYVDLMVRRGETAQAIVVFKRLARWLCGRQDETFWDDYIEDDREWDQMHWPRRLEVNKFDPTKYPDLNYGESMPLDLRGKLGILRLRLNFREEAQSHFDWLEPELEGEESLVEEYSDTFYEVAKGLHDAGQHAQALHFYTALHNAEIDLGLEFLKDMAASCYVCGQLERALSLYEYVFELEPDSIAIQTELTKLFTDLGDRRMALKHGNEAVVRAHARVPESDTRKYERKESRLLREGAERALKNAYKLPKKPGSKKPGKVPKGLQYRNRYRRKFERWVPEWDTPAPATPQPVTPFEIVNRVSAAPSIEPEREETPPMYSRPIKIPRRPGRPKGSRPLARKPPNQMNATRHYEEMQQLYKTLIEHQPGMREGDEYSINIWMDCAAAMLEDFRNVKIFYPGERHKKFEGYTTQIPQPRPPTPQPPRNAESPAVEDDVNPEQMSPRHRSSTPMRSDVPPDMSARTLAPKGMPDEYCGIRFATWLDIFLELAILHANSASLDAQHECYTLINACIDCSLFYHDEPTMVQIHSCFLACCLALGDDLTLYNIVLRWFMREYAFCTDTYRLYSSMALLSELPAQKDRLTDAVFKSAPNHKFVFRQIMSIDKLLPEDYNRDGAQGGVPAFMRKHREELRKLSKTTDASGIFNPNSLNGTSRTSGSPACALGSNSGGTKLHTPTEMDVVLFVLYAQMMMASNSFPNALSYLYRAYSLDPTNAACLLTMSLCYIHELFKRQTGNRHSYALMGWAWFGQYEEHRLKWAEKVDRENEVACLEAENVNDDNEDNPKPKSVKMVDVVKREIEFNKARCWELLGMADLGMRSYQKVLDMAPQKQQVSKDMGNTNVDEAEEREQEEDEEEVEEHWTMEAAYAMATMYALNGNGQKAMEITEKHLVVE
ncbi:transcription factor TFIIIC subunit tfc4 [Lithohypha guttulata]|uniref:transcription factor TFIIIC subunit tfc4 n=1 Tax=Lithohypha guttulata TaxID=1690604 RepID=UPI002DDE5B15|nr:transcription factor TFIIIC subunit tfc4 [Lithohypha guttulata]